MNQKINIMVVDDEIIVRESLYHRFKKYGHAVHTAASGGEALAKLEKRPFDLMFVDMKMPEMDGIELLEQVKFEYPETTVVIITAFGSVESAVKAMRIGAADYLMKPFDTDQLNLVMEKILQQRAMLAEFNYLNDHAEESQRCDIFFGQSEIVDQTSDAVVKVEKMGQILLLTLNRPEAMNTLNFTMLRSLKEVLIACDRAPGVRVVIITGAGDRAFCAGADLKERIKLSKGEVRFYNKIMDKFTFAEDLNKPVIAAINGVAYGAGTELALASDICIASSNAKFGLIQSRLSNIPGAGGTQRLPRLVGKLRAKELIYTGRIIPAQEAFAIGLVNKVCEPERLMNEAFIFNSPEYLPMAAHTAYQGWCQLWAISQSNGGRFGPRAHDSSR